MIYTINSNNKKKNQHYSHQHQHQPSSQNISSSRDEIYIPKFKCLPNKISEILLCSMGISILCSLLPCGVWVCSKYENWWLASRLMCTLCTQYTSVCLIRIHELERRRREKTFVFSRKQLKTLFCGKGFPLALASSSSPPFSAAGAAAGAAAADAAVWCVVFYYFGRIFHFDKWQIDTNKQPTKQHMQKPWKDDGASVCVCGGLRTDCGTVNNIRIGKKCAPLLFVRVCV